MKFRKVLLRFEGRRIFIRIMRRYLIDSQRTLDSDSDSDSRLKLEFVAHLQGGPRYALLNVNQRHCNTHSHTLTHTHTPSTAASPFCLASPATWVAAFSISLPAVATIGVLLAQPIPVPVPASYSYSYIYIYGRCSRNRYATLSTTAKSSLQ